MVNKKLLLKIQGGKKFVLKPRTPEEIAAIKTGVITGRQQPMQQQQQQPPGGSFIQFIDQRRFVHGHREPRKIAEKSEIEGITIPKIHTEKLTIPEIDDVRLVNMKYPLMPSEPKKGEKVMSYAHIFFDKKSGEVIYNVVEPPIGNNQKTLMEIKEYIQEKLDINFSQIRKTDAVSYLNSAFERALAYFRVKVDKNTEEILRYYVIRDFIGLEKLEPLMNDKNIEDISCDGVNIPIYVYHRNPQFGSIRTNMVFKDSEELDLFVNKLSERSGKTISVARPLLDGTLPGGARLQATLGSDIARNGSNFTIRMFSDKPMTPVDTIRYGTSDLRMMAYFWFLIEHGSSVLISGGTASGKTSLLNVLSLFIKPQMKIISIEDTSELRLPHAHWVPEVARTAISEEGRVDMFELLRESLRQRPDYIIVGEVRGKEAYVLFQQMAVGHPGLSTIHAENFSKLFDRMTSPPISLAPNLLQNLDLIVFIKRVKQGRRYNRRIFSVTEVVGYDQEAKLPITNELLTWDAKRDKFHFEGKSALLKKISDTVGLTERDVKREIENRAKVLKWLVNRGITDYRKIASVISMFYLSPDFLLGRIEGEL